jgi:helix-turn-helix protein
MSPSTYSTPHNPQRPHDGARDAPAVFSTKEAAAYLGVAAPTLRTWRHRRRGPKSFRMEGRIVYRRSALDEFIDACESADSRSNRELDPLNRPPELKVRGTPPRAHERSEA